MKLILPIILMISVVFLGIIIGLVVANTVKMTKKKSNIMWITTTILVATLNIGLYLYYEIPVTWTIVIGILSGGFAGGVVRAFTYSDEKEADSYSIGRMERINQVMTSLFGQKWPYVLLVFAVVLAIALFSLFLYIKNIEIELKDSNYLKLQKSILWFGIGFTIIVAVLTVLAIQKYRQQQEKEEEELGDFAKTTDYKQIMQMIGIILLLVTAVGISIWLLHSFRK